MNYFDHAATSYPKPPCVQRAVQQAFWHYGANPGRSGHSLSMKTAMKVYECREKVAEFFGAAVDEVVFTSSCTHSLNMAIKGCLHIGDHVIISDLEHNSVLRPVYALVERGLIRYSVVSVQEDDDQTAAAFAAAITPRTRLIACTHASNAFGIRLPIEQIADVARRHGVLFLVDAAQTAGVVDINLQKTPVDFLCMAGHKSLYGPTGTGILITRHGEQLSTLMEGGTGSASANFAMPQAMPDRLEAGTANTLGIIGIGAGIDFIRKRGMETIRRHEMAIGREIFRQLEAIPQVELYTPSFVEGRNVPVISFNVQGIPSEELTARLSDMGFALRGGLHCSPLAHRKMETLETGTARISIGCTNTMEQAGALCRAIRRIAGS